MNPLELRVLGPLELIIDGAPAPLGTPKARALLAVLACYANRTLSAPTLVAALWGDDPPRTADKNLHGYVHQLRRAFVDPRRITRRPPGYALLLDDDELDALRFRLLVHQARQALATGRAEEARAVVGEGLALWRGRAFADVQAVTAVRDEAVALEEVRLGALELQARANLDLGHHAEVVAELLPLVSAHPMHEALRARLMVALYRCGRQVDALATYRAYRELLADSAGLDPGGELAELELAILRRDASLAAPPPAGGTDGGVPVTGGPGTARPAELPAGPAEFVGRAGELEQLDGLLPGDPTQAPATVVVSAVAGMAGVGKTALALHWAHRVAGRFPDGQLHVDLHGYSGGAPVRPAQALAQLLRSLGVAAERVPAETAEAAGLFRSLLAGRRMLVVLDNANSAEQIRALLPGVPGCVVLVTSRDRLTGLAATHGAHRLTLDALSPGEAAGLLSRLVGAGRVAAEPAALAELARTCAHLPLALRIAAANLADRPTQPLAGYVAELAAGDRLAALEVHGDRQAAVRAAFDTSYQRLDPEGQRMFRLLGLVPGATVTVPAAAALAGVAPATAGRLLDQLAAAHLLQSRSPGRFGFHDLLRGYARDRAARDDGEQQREAALGRLLGWYLHTADDAAAQLNPGAVRLPLPPADPGLPPPGWDDPDAALAWLDADWDNLAAAVAHAAAHGHHRLAWLLADAMRPLFWMRRGALDWIPVARAGLAAARLGNDLAAQAAAELGLGDAHHSLGRYRQAIGHHSAALRLARQAGWRQAQAAVLVNLGIANTDLGRLDRALERYRAGLALFRELGDRRGEAAALFNLGSLQSNMGALHDAIRSQCQALALAREAGSTTGAAFAHLSLGETTYALGDLDRATRHLTRALTLHRRAGNRTGEAFAAAALAGVHAAAGRHRQAHELATAAQALADQTGEAPIRACAHNALGTVASCQGRHSQATSHHQRALALARTAGASHAETRALLGLAAASRHSGQLAQAIEHAHQALDLATTIGYRLLQADAHATLAAAHLDAGDHDQATHHADHAIALHQHTGSRPGHAPRHDATSGSRAGW